jgi:hypothetical protein
MMKKLICIAALAAVASAVPAEAHGKMHHHAAAAQPDHVTVDGKDYKVCSGAIQDGCVNPRQAGLSFGNEPINHYEPHDDMPH